VSCSRAGPIDGNFLVPARLQLRDSRHCIGSDIHGFWPHNTASYIYGCPLSFAAEVGSASTCASVQHSDFRPLLSKVVLAVGADRDRPAAISAWPRAARAVSNGWRWQMGSNLVPCHTAIVNRYSTLPRTRRWYTKSGQLNSMTSVESQAEVLLTTSV